jgi:D-arginine dehydrogenase
MSRFDFAIAGAGIAGATLAAELAPHGSVIVLEEEDVAGYHATGRSAAFWSETYGGPAVQPLTIRSRPALDPFLAPLGSVHIGRAEEAPAIEAFLAEFAGTGVTLTPVDPADHIPGLRPEWTLGVYEPSCAYIDVAGLHAEALARLRRAGGVVRLSAGVRAAERSGGDWRIDTADGPVSAGIFIDAAGAWADGVARLAGVAPIGIQPYRRTLAQLRTEPAAPDGMAHVSHIGGSFYFKPEAGGRLWLSPHDETPVEPSDVQPEELDVAIAIDRLEHVVDWRITAVERKWAGLRSFAPDRLPVYGFAPDQPGFFWCAGQGGFGIQTAPAAARLAAALVLGTTPELDPAPYAPDRFAPA